LKLQLCGAIAVLALLLPAGTALAASPDEPSAPLALDQRKEDSALTVSKELLADTGYWEQAVIGSPEDVTLHLALGNAYALRRMYAPAIKEYRGVLRVYPESKAAWNNLGSVHRATGKMSEALDAFRKALKLDSRYGLAYYNMGAVYDSEGHYDRALRNYSLAFRYDPSLFDSKENPQVVMNKRLYAVLLQNYVESAGSLVLPLEPAYQESPGK
jgi:tetratricopeptide (TPR) repeat protein